MSFPPPPLIPILTSISQILKDRKQTVAVVETAAGGLISASLLSVPGASAYFAGGLTLYTLKSRIAFGGWSEEDREAYKGPTPEVVLKLARHARGVLNATYTIAESGTAGPNANPYGTDMKPNRRAGYLAIAAVGPRRELARDVVTGCDVREENQVLFAKATLELLLGMLNHDGESESGEVDDLTGKSSL